MSVDVLGGLGLSDADAAHRRIGATYIVDYGIIKDIPTDGIVTVEMSASKDKQSITVTNCILASFASSSFTVKIKPNIDDKVIVLFPKNYSSRMFDKEVNETIISQATEGYCLLGGIAILLNQFQDFHKNYIDFSDGCADIKLAYSEDDDKNFISLNTNKDGEITLTVKDKFSQKINKDGEITLTVKDKFSQKIDKDGALNITSNNTSIKINKDNEITVNNGKATVTIDKNGNVKIDTSGKYTIKNSSTNLKDVIDGVAKELENLTTVGSPATQATSPASKTTITTWRKSKLNLLFE